MIDTRNSLGARQRRDGELRTQRAFGQVALGEVHAEVAIAFLRFAGAAGKAASRRADIAELEEERRQRSGDVVAASRRDHVGDEALLVGNLLLAVDAGTAGVVAGLTQEDIGGAARCLVSGENLLHLRPTGLRRIAAGGPDGRLAGHASRRAGAINVVGNVIDAGGRRAVAAELRGLAFNQRNDDFDIAEAGGVEGGAQVLRGGRDGRRRLLPEKLVAQLDADDGAVLQELTGRRVERSDVGRIGIVLGRLAEVRRWPRRDVAAYAVEHRGRVVGAAVRKRSAAVGAVGRAAGGGQSGDAVVVSAEDDLDAGVLRRSQDVVVRGTTPKISAAFSPRIQPGCTARRTLSPVFRMSTCRMRTYSPCRAIPR